MKKKKKDVVKYPISLHREMYDELKKISDREMVSIASLIRVGIKGVIRTHKRRKG